MPRRKQYTPIKLINAWGPKRQCPHCLGWTRALKGQTLEQAIAVHESTCPAIHRINPPKKGR